MNDTDRLKWLIENYEMDFIGGYMEGYFDGNDIYDAIDKAMED